MIMMREMEMKKENSLEYTPPWLIFVCAVFEKHV